MSKINLSKYALERLKERERHILTPGPVITISREYGCPSKIIAEMLTKKINELTHKKKWNWISKDILEDSAKKLGMTPREIKYVFEYKEHTIVDEILAAQAKRYYYHSERTIRKTIGEVIRATGMEGYVVIVGRAGVVLTRDIEASLHIRLTAPQRWRVVHVSKNHNIPFDKACKIVRDLDSKRKKFIEYYLRNPMDHSIFDILYNCSTMSKEMIVQSVIDMARQKKLI